MFVRMLKLPEEVRTKYDVSSLTSVVHAAAPCPVDVKRQMIEWWGPIIHEYYAGTEGNGFVYTGSAEWLTHPGTVGRAVLGTVHIVDDDGEELPTGEPGTIYFEGGADVRVPQRRRQDGLAPATSGAGPRWATSATSTPRATST